MSRWNRKLSWAPMLLAAAIFAFPGPAVADEPALAGNLRRGFDAVYRLVASPDQVGASVFEAALSGDGRRAVFLAWDDKARQIRLYDYAVDTQRLDEIAMPPDCLRIGSLTIDHDGSRAYFTRQHIGEGGRLIYKIENGQVSTILDAAEHDDVNGCHRLRTTADGEWVYFAEDRDDLWRVPGDGGKPELVIADEQVRRDGGRAAHLGEFDISADGGTVAFVINGLIDEGGAWIPKSEVFVQHAGEIRQVTNDSENNYKQMLALSENGEILFYAAGGKHNSWFVAKTSGGDPRPLEPLGINAAIPDLTADGSIAIYSDGLAQGGRLLRTDGSGVLNLFPIGNVQAINLAAYQRPQISDAGNRVLFRQNDKLYVGFLEPDDASREAPRIGPARLAASPVDEAAVNRESLRLIVEVRADDVLHVVANTLIDGRFQTNSADLAYAVPHDPRDDGEPPDRAAQDGTYTAWVDPAGKPELSERQVFRIGLQKRDGLVTVTDFAAGGGVAPPRPPFDPDKVIYDPDVGRELIRDEVLVTLFRNIPRGRLEEVLNQLGFEARILDSVPALDLYKIGVPPNRRVEARERLAVHPIVAAAGYNTLWEATITFNDPVFAVADEDDWGLRKINAPQAWDITLGGAPIAIIDTGVRLDHEELIGKTFNAFSYATNSGQMQTGLVQVKTDKGLMTRWICSHGTHVAVTAAGRAGNQLGTAGVSPDSPVLPIQYLYYVPELQRITNTDFEVNVAIERALAANVQVINLSLGKSIKKEWIDQWEDPATKAEAEKKIYKQVDLWLEPLKGALDAAHQQRVILCKSAGNDDVPARFNDICYSRRAIVVAATSPNDERYERSNFGDYTTVSAPGMGIYSATSGPENYIKLTGTSMATPHVTGIVALMKTLKPDLTLEEAREILVVTGRKLVTDKPIGPLVNARAALEELQKRIEQNVPPPKPQPPLLPQPPVTPQPPPAPQPPAPEPPPPPVNVLEDPEPWKYAEVRDLIDRWLATAIPTEDREPGPWFYDKYGRLVNNKSLYATQPPDHASYRHKFLWGLARKFDSKNLGTMYDYVVKNLKSPQPANK